MCLMCEQEAFYQAYLDYVAAKQAEAAKVGTQNSAPAMPFKAEAADTAAAATDATAASAGPARARPDEPGA